MNNLEGLHFLSIKNTHSWIRPDMTGSSKSLEKMELSWLFPHSYRLRDTYGVAALP